MKQIIIFLTLAVSLLGCSDDENLGESGLLPPNVEKNEIDDYIKATFTDPYNMVIDYKWPSNEVDNSKIILPIKYELVKPFCELLKNLWINPYVKHINDEFVKKYIPKQVILVGTPNYNADGTVTEGIAEGGRKITIFSINSLNFKDKNMVRKQFGTMHHEFAHILHQTINYDETYQQITPRNYTLSWYDFNHQQAWERGYVTPYSMESPDEDFVEMYAHMLILTDEEWNDMLSYPKTDVEAIKRKEAIVADYMLENWNIDVYELKKLIQKQLDEL
ncbi:hypothetical protein EYV94_04580 [Puteibacter caeruleilacunae]|nr:hypothetical protein EYV94_04580 [Puteibacter caeruleilacunae]